MPTNVRDPRTIITPDAFGISPDLLGTPLAKPSTRLWAILIDLLVVGVLTAMLGGIGSFIWGVVAALLLWVAFQRTTGHTPTASVLLRASAGCLGFFILGLLLVVWLVGGMGDGPGGGGGPGVDVSVGAMEEIAEERGIGALGLARLVVEGLAGTRALDEAETATEAEAAALAFLRGLDELGLDRGDRLEILRELTPGDAPWADEADAVYARALDRWEGSEDRTSGPETGGVAGELDPADSAAVADEVAALDDRAVLEAYGAALLRDDTMAADTAVAPGAALRTHLLRRRAAELLVGDTLTALAGQVSALQQELHLAEIRRRAAEEETQQGGSALVELLRDIWDQLGSAIGFWSVYFTAVLTLLDGRTVGKKLLGLRVVRLDAQRMTLWAAFERAGGYVAGLATGLLGFAQVFWDPNRQCIHDKIVGTVVVDERAEGVPGSWKEAWTDPAGPLQREREDER